MKSFRTLPPHARRLPCVVPASALAALLTVFALPAAANNFTVTTGTDGSQQVGNTSTCVEVDNTNTPTGNGCSLRAAIMLGNNITGPHAITFNPAVTTVTVVNGDLAQLRAQYTITGALPLRTAINGSGHGCLDLTDSGTDQDVPTSIKNGKGATGSTISNLVIGNCSGAGISANGHGYTFQNNYIGVDPTGLVAWPNSGNGIWLSASIAYDDQFVDTTALNNINSALPVQPVDAVGISDFSTGLAGVLVNLQPNTIKDNVISGNALNGIELFSKTLAATLMSNNMIGTDPTGAFAIANGNNGVHLVGSTFGNLIGPGNVIAGNTQNGIQVDAGAVYLPNFIMGNRIGLSNVDGAHVGNAQSGIVVDTRPSTDPTYLNPSLTGLVIGPLNVIADNQGTNNALNLDDQNDTQGGILITGASTGIKVLGNTIGLAEFPAGMPLASTAYANLGDGIIVTTSGNQIGGSTAGSANIVAANARHGIFVRGSATTGNSFVGNSVGVHPGLGGNLALGNGVDGFHIDNASATTIGGSGSSDFNTIAANGRNGVKIVHGGSSNGWGNLLQRNRIYHNAVAMAGVGIDLDRAQNASNPLITGPAEYPSNYTNLDQAQPVICTGPGDTGACAGSTAPVSNGSSVTLQWTITTHGPAANLRVEFFALDTADVNTATQFGWYDEQTVDTDANGKPTGASCSNGRCSMTISGALSGAWLTMTATDITALTDVAGAPGDWKAGLKCFIGKFGDPTGIISACPANNTSEFSNVASVPALAPSATTTAASAITTTGATLNGIVNDNGAVTAVSFEYGLDTNYGTLATAIPASVAAGSGNTQITGPISGLTCGTTYHFRIKASNGIGGIIFGSDLTFDTVACPALAPTVATTAATNITATTATVNGTVSANGASTGVDFVYGATAAYGLSVNANAPNPLPANASNAAVAGDLHNLTCGTQYHFRAEAANGVGGTQFGNDLTFTTAACSAPDATTLAATNVTTSSITFNGSVNANGNDATVLFDYGPTSSYGSSVAATPGTVLANAGISAVTATVAAGCGTTVHFRVRATNAINTTNGNDLSAVMGACGATPPTVSTSAATNITATGATLNGSGNANGFSTTVTWEYGTTASYGQTAPGVPSPLSGSSNTAVTANLSGLTCATTYHFRLDASSSGGSVNTPDNTFTTSACPAGAPTAATNAASAIAATSATLNGTVSANGAATTVSFDYGLTTSYGSNVAAAQSPLALNASNAPVSYAASGLSCGLTYHFRVVADNGNGGPVHGGDQSFTTSACAAQPPTAATNAATAVAATSATLNGTVSANGAATTVSFDYGPTTGYGSNVAATQSPLAANASNAPVSIIVGSLACNQTYHFRVVADNGDVGGPVHGGDQSFTTSACAAQAPTATSLAATAIGTTSATINGTVNANGAAATVAFAYGVTAAYGSTIAATPASLPANAVGTAVSATLGGLSCGTTYHFRVDATNINGAGHGGDLTFTTAACPVVTTFSGPTATGTGNAHAVLSGGGPTCTLSNAAFVAAPASPPPGISFPDGLFQFQASGCTGSITLTVTFPSPFTAGVQYWKYGPTSGQNSNHWYTLGAANNLSLLANVATFTIADGGLGDDDLSINGTIIDAGGPSIAAAVNPQAATPAPALDPRNLMALIALLAAFGAAAARRQVKTVR